MTKQQIFSFSLHSDTDNELIGDLLSRKNRSSYIRRALKNMERYKKSESEFDHLYLCYANLYELYMEKLGIDQFIVPEKHTFRQQ